MSAFGGKADNGGVGPLCLLIARSGHLSDGFGGKTTTMAAQIEYGRHGFEGYLGNISVDVFGRYAFSIPPLYSRATGNCGR